MKRLALMLGIAVVALTGCATTAKNFSDVEMSIPLTKTMADPDVNLKQYGTFTFIKDDKPKNRIEEKYLLYFLKGLLSQKGYVYVSSTDSADILITVDYDNTYRTVYVPPSQMTLPNYTPAKTITKESNYLGFVDDIPVYSVGTETTTIPGSWSTKEYTIPGRTVGNYYPSLAISMYEAKTLNNIWFGSSTIYTDISDIRISSQFLILDIIGYLPNTENITLLPQYHRGKTGINYTMMTVNGNDYYPTIIHTAPGMPAQKAGVLLFDQIVAVDNQSTKGCTIEDFRKLISRDPGESANFAIWRNGQVIEKTIKYMSR